ncbi:MAG: Rrf2 family transcriptional regulator, partial [Oscillospiraceae bacterium]|nr:Rrf2 family transcriptional regulator [Oscillospiraceae bacterium]
MDIALYEEDGKPISVISISKRQNLSMKYLEQILMVLRRANLVRNLKGWKGGYIIAKPAKQITLRTVIDALDRTILADVTVQELIDDVALKEIIN